MAAVQFWKPFLVIRGSIAGWLHHVNDGNSFEITPNTVSLVLITDPMGQSIVSLPMDYLACLQKIFDPPKFPANQRMIG
jgi:hypothetical protein